jgi:hypothetical protein
VQVDVKLHMPYEYQTAREREREYNPESAIFELNHENLPSNERTAIDKETEYISGKLPTKSYYNIDD